MLQKDRIRALEKQLVEITLAQLTASLAETGMLEEMYCATNRQLETLTVKRELNAA